MDSDSERSGSEGSESGTPGKVIAEHSGGADRQTNVLKDVATTSKSGVSSSPSPQTLYPSPQRTYPILHRTCPSVYKCPPPPLQRSSPSPHRSPSPHGSSPSSHRSSPSRHSPSPSTHRSSPSRHSPSPSRQSPSPSSHRSSPSPHKTSVLKKVRKLNLPDDEEKRASGEVVEDPSLSTIAEEPEAISTELVLSPPQLASTSYASGEERRRYSSDDPAELELPRRNPLISQESFDSKAPPTRSTRSKMTGLCLLTVLALITAAGFGALSWTDGILFACGLFALTLLGVVFSMLIVYSFF